MTKSDLQRKEIHQDYLVGATVEFEESGDKGIVIEKTLPSTVILLENGDTIVMMKHKIIFN